MKKSCDFLKKKTNEMNDYLDFISKGIRSSSSRVGWDEDFKFTLGDVTYSDENKYHSVKRNIFLDSTMIRGDISDWRLFLKSAYSGANALPHQLVICLGFAAPIYSLMSKMKTVPCGGLVHIFGFNSGVGKTSVVQTALRIYGDDRNFLRSNFPIKSFLKDMSRANSIPMGIDEITEFSSKEIAALAYNLSAGNITFGSKDTTLNWSSFAFSTANNSIVTKITDARSNGQAVAMRVLEIPIVSLPSDLSKSESDKIMREGSKVWGIAGHIWINYIAKNREKVSQLFIEEQKKFDSLCKTKQKHRYWSSIISSALCAAKLSYDLGLHEFNYDDLFEYCQDLFYKIESSSENRFVEFDNSNPIYEFISKNKRHIVTIKSSSALKNTRAINKKYKPFIKYNKIENVIYLSCNHLRLFCNQENLDYASLKNNFDRINVMKRTVRMASRTTIKSDEDLRCYVLDLSNKDHVDLCGFSLFKDFYGQI